MMKSDVIVKALKCLRVQTGSLVCMGCGHEHDCGVHGCAIMRQAADLIERLEKEKAEARWISVTERLPEKQQRVIVRCKTVGTTAGWIMFDEWVTDLGPGCGEVTHWMPLPKAPEMK